MNRQARKEEKAERKRAKKEAEAREQESGTPAAPADSGSADKQAEG